MDSPPLSSPYSIRMRIRDATYQFIRYIYALLNIPGLVRPLEYADRVTGDFVRIKVTRRFTIISVNHRDYWFKRLTGRFDGTGYSVCEPILESPDCILGYIPESAPPLSLWGRLKVRLQSIGWGCFW